MTDVMYEADRIDADETLAFEPPAIVDYGDVAKETRAGGGSAVVDAGGYS